MCCTRYISPETAAIEREWHVGRHNPWRAPETPIDVFPGYLAPFIRRARDVPEPRRELTAGQWNLIPWFAKEPKQKFATCNARSEELADKASYKLPWARGQRCIIPAAVFFEPNWETGKHVPWKFERVDGAPWGLAGLWNTWLDKATGEVHESYTMLTINADGHPLMGRMHRPDPKRPPHMQDKRATIPIELEDVDLWLFGTVEQASTLVRLPPAEWYAAAPAV
jgi:putative SOS response-associated peptidase YedK